MLGYYILSGQKIKMKRIPKEKRTLALALIVEGNTINGICRMLKIGKPNLLRFLKEVGEACEDWHDEHFKGIQVTHLELDEQWAYVGKHKERMSKREKMENPEKGDSWLWAGIDPKSKAIVSWRTGKRNKATGYEFLSDLAIRIDGEVQITTDQLPTYNMLIPGVFGDRASHAEETKKFEKISAGGAEWMKYGTGKLVRTEREAASGNPDLGKATTSHIERFFLTVRQGNKRSARKTLAYSKEWENHALMTSIHIFIYNMVRKHETTKTAPAVSLGLIDRPWSLEDVVEMTDRYLKRVDEEAFERAFAEKFSTEPKSLRTYKPEMPKIPWYLDPESGGRNPDVRKPGVSYPGDSEFS